MTPTPNAPAPSQPIDEPYWTIKDPDGHLIHTHVSTFEDEAIEDFLKTEQAMNALYNAARVTHGREEECCPSWEGFEAKGYTAAKVKLTEIL